MEDTQILTDQGSEWPPAIPVSEAPDPPAADVRQVKFGRISKRTAIVGLGVWIAMIPVALLLSSLPVDSSGFATALGFIMVIGGFGLEVTALVFGIKGRSTGAARFGLVLSILALGAGTLLLSPHILDHALGNPGGCGL